MKSARVAAALSAMGPLAGCQPTDEQKLQSWLSAGLPERLADCIAERTYDALTPGEEKAFHDAVSERFRASPGSYATERPYAGRSANIDRPRSARRCGATGPLDHRTVPVHNWRLH